MILILFIVAKAAATFYLLSVLFVASSPALWSASIRKATDSGVAASAHNMGVSACSVRLCRALRKGRFAVSGNPLFVRKENPHFPQ